MGETVLMLLSIVLDTKGSRKGVFPSDGRDFWEILCICVFVHYNVDIHLISPEN